MYIHIFVCLKGDSVFNFIIKEGKEKENWRILPEFPLQEKNRKEKLKEVTEKNNNTGLCEMNRVGPLGREYGYNIITLYYHLWGSLRRNKEFTILYRIWIILLSLLVEDRQIYIYLHVD